MTSHIDCAVGSVAGINYIASLCITCQNRLRVCSYSFGTRAADWPVASNFSKPDLRGSAIASLFLDLLPTNTCVYPPTAAGLSLPCWKTPTSYVTELLPSLVTLSPRSRTSGNPTGAKNCVKTVEKYPYESLPSTYLAKG